MNKLFETPSRTAKPRTQGVTMVIDSNLGSHAMSDMVEVGGDLIDYVKLGWGTAMINPILKKKIRYYKDHGIRVCLGGTFYECAFINKSLDNFEYFLKDIDVTMMEISDGTVMIPRKTKLRHIEHFSKTFKVLSEYGNKDASIEIKAPHFWVKHMQEELDAGAWKVIAEGRESGTAGLYRGTSELRTGLVDEIAYKIDQEMILWEAPKKSHQAWFIKKFGANVNLGNIAPSDVLPLETLRLGLRSDTLLHFHANK